MIQIQQNTTTEMSLDQMVRHVKGIVDMRSAIIQQVKDVISACGITSEDIYGPVVKKPFQFYCNEIKAGYTGFGQKPVAFGDRDHKLYPIKDEDAERIAQLAKRDVLTISGKLVKFVEAE